VRMPPASRPMTSIFGFAAIPFAAVCLCASFRHSEQEGGFTDMPVHHRHCQFSQKSDPSCVGRGFPV